MPLARSTHTDESQVPQTDADRAFAILQRRDAPKFFIADAVGSVQFSSPSLVDGLLLEASKRVLVKLHREGRTISELIFVQLNAEFMLRIVPLTGELTSFFAVFIEPIGGRKSLELARKRYGLTKREWQVVEQIMKGHSTPRIAPQLFISESTVGDHIKSIFRKTGTNSRAELLVRIFQSDTPPDDGVAAGKR